MIPKMHNTKVCCLKKLNYNMFFSFHKSPSSQVIDINYFDPTLLTVLAKYFVPQIHAESLFSAVQNFRTLFSSDTALGHSVIKKTTGKAKYPRMELQAAPL